MTHSELDPEMVLNKELLLQFLEQRAAEQMPPTDVTTDPVKQALIDRFKSRRPDNVVEVPVENPGSEVTEAELTDLEDQALAGLIKRFADLRTPRKF